MSTSCFTRAECELGEETTTCIGAIFNSSFLFLRCQPLHNGTERLLLLFVLTNLFFQGHDFVLSTKSQILKILTTHIRYSTSLACFGLFGGLKIKFRPSHNKPAI